MRKRKLSLNRELHENMSIIFCFAYSRKSFQTLSNRFKGEWKFLMLMLYEIPESHADRAPWELAIQLRAIDDEENLSGYNRERGYPALGVISKRGGVIEELFLRDMTNKIIHSVGYEWLLESGLDPQVVCHSSNPERWETARFNLAKLAAFCSTLMS
jgi:hypothetical protein